MRYIFPRPIYNFFQRFGVHVIPNHFYSPTFDTAVLASQPQLWQNAQELRGLNLSLPEQKQFLRTVVQPYRDEIATFPTAKPTDDRQYYLTNGAYGYSSAALLYGIIRHFKPHQVVEVGSGFSTLVSAQAARQNKKENRLTKVIAIEPYPNQVLQKGLPGLSQLKRIKVESLAPSYFESLSRHDVLFIDSSHVVKIGGDVTYLILEVLPRLKKGVIIHIHDIFFPYHYPRDWVINRGRFWSEQYLVQAFLCFNPRFKILWSGSYMFHAALNDLKKVLPPPPGLSDSTAYMSSSLWLQVV